MEEWKKTLTFMIIISLLLGTLIPRLVELIQTKETLLIGWYCSIIILDCGVLFWDYSHLKSILEG